MEILMLTNAVAPDKLGGLERYVRELSAVLVERGVRVVVLTKQVRPDLPRREVGDDGVEIIRYRVPPKSDPLFALRYPLSGLRETLTMSQSRSRLLVHAHFPLPAVALALTRRPYLYTFHSPVYKEVIDERQDTYRLPRAAESLLVAGVRSAERLLLRRAQQVSVLSDYSRREVAALDERVAATTTDVIPGGIDRERFRPRLVSRDEWAADAEPLLVCARRLTPRAGVRELVEAMSLVRRELPRARLAIAGDGHLRPEVERAVALGGLQSSVRLLGQLESDELVDWYCRADLVVLPTQRLEGFGLATAEALACGTPVVGTRMGATPELLTPVSPHLLSDGITPEALARAIVSAYENADNLAAARMRARDSTVHLDWAVVVDRYLELYERLAGSTRRSPRTANGHGQP